MGHLSSVLTVGHSTRSLDEFIEILKSFQIEILALKGSLRTSGIDYIHLPELGGRRRPLPDSLNMTWRNESFRGYADYMETDEFRDGIDRLLALGRDRRTVIMCSEAVWWRCHRSMISDYLKAKGVAVIHILAAGKSEAHPYTSVARIVNGELSYRGVLETDT